jgi:hypothetical protein
MVTALVLLGLMLLFVIPVVLVYLLQHKIIFAPQYYNRRRLKKVSFSKVWCMNPKRKLSGQCSISADGSRTVLR